MYFHFSQFYPILWYFIIYAFFGWCCEVVFCSVNTGKFVNRGFLNGPLCPIYGFGVVSIVLCLRPIADNILLLFIGSVILCSVLELITGFILKKLFSTTWWDYSDQPFNIGGYICLKFSLLWGLGCVGLIHLIQPGVEKFVHSIPYKIGWPLLAILYCLILFDLIITILEISKLNRDLEEITHLTEKLRRPSNALAKSLGNSAITVADKLETKFEEIEPKERIEELLKRHAPMRKRLIKAFPKMRSTQYHDALEKLRHRHIDNEK